LAIEESDIARVMAAVQAGDAVSAEQDCRRLLRAHPDHETALVLLAVALQHQHLPLRAAAIHERLTVLYPDHAVHWTNLATVLREVGRLDEAEDAYRIALRLAPDDAVFLVNLGVLY
jgi:Flp pilus assembly protein TadD